MYGEGLNVFVPSIGAAPTFFCPKCLDKVRSQLTPENEEYGIRDLENIFPEVDLHRVSSYVLTYRHSNVKRNHRDDNQ
jgi:hypothetical protein